MAAARMAVSPSRLHRRAQSGEVPSLRAPHADGRIGYWFDPADVERVAEEVRARRQAVANGVSLYSARKQLGEKSNSSSSGGSRRAGSSP